MRELDDIGFWKKRIDGETEIHKTVYVVAKVGWDRIEAYNKKIVQKETSGKILDAGCGYGRMSEWVKDYTGIDFSPDFIALAQKRYPDKKFVIGDLRKLPFKDREFDWAVCISIKNMIQRYVGLEDWDLMEKELKRVAKKVLILEYISDEYEVLCE